MSDQDIVQIKVQSSVDGLMIAGVGDFDAAPNSWQSQKLAGLLKNVLNNVEHAGDTAADAVESYAIERAGEVLEAIGSMTNDEDDRWYCAAAPELARAIRAMHAATTTLSPSIVGAMRESVVAAILAAAEIVTGEKEHYSPQRAYLAGYRDGYGGGEDEVARADRDRLAREGLHLWLHGTEVQ